MQEDKIWVTWEKQRRNQSMSRALKVPLYELTSEQSRLLRYVELGVKTVCIFHKTRPRNVFAQNPSIVLSFLVIILRPAFGYKAIIDQHNSGLFPLEGRSRFLNLVARWVVRRADAVIVTNTALATQCRKWHGYPIVMPDPLPQLDVDQFSSFQHHSHGSQLRIFCICTWADDEPIGEILRAAGNLDSEKVVIEITGTPCKDLNINSLPKAVKILGFISDEEYLKRLSEAHGVLVLTNREDCLNCGAYEAVALRKPGVLSDKKEIRKYFNKGFIYTNNISSEITEALMKLVNENAYLTSQVEMLKTEIHSNESQYVERLEAVLGIVSG